MLLAVAYSAILNGEGGGGEPNIKLDKSTENFTLKFLKIRNRGGFRGGGVSPLAPWLTPLVTSKRAKADAVFVYKSWFGFLFPKIVQNTRATGKHGMISPWVCF